MCIRDSSRRAHSSTRTSLGIGADSEVSFATYFNAFAAAYWRRWTVLDEVVLRLTVRGAGRVDLYRSKIDGSRIAITGDVVGEPGQAGQVTTVEFVCDLGPFEDGGWIWFDLTSDTDVELLSGGWYSAVDAPATRPDAGPDGRPDPAVQVPNDRRVTVGIPTFNRPGDAVAALRALSLIHI